MTLLLDSCCFPISTPEKSSAFHLTPLAVFLVTPLVVSC
jgi:hypothetical protein